MTVYTQIWSRIPKRIIRGLSRRPIVVVTALSLGVRVGKEVFRLKKGSIDAPEFRARTGSHLGGMSGGIAGAAVGAAAGSVVPLLGTIVGGFAGGIIGENVGSKAGRKAAATAERYFDENDAPVPPSSDEA